MGQGSRTRDLRRSQELPMGQGPRIRDLRMSRELTRQLSPSPWRPPWDPLTRESRGP
jgi:hypothetical protein